MPGKDEPRIVALINPAVRFGPELDLEEIKELPGKEFMKDLHDKFSEEVKCSDLIQDSHGWCFYAHGSDGRKYLLELLYVTTDANGSNWVLKCDRSSGLRFWELFNDANASRGKARELLEKATDWLKQLHGFQLDPEGNDPH